MLGSLTPGATMADAKKVSNFIIYGTPVDRETVNKVFGEIPKIYTELYENIKNNWTLEQIMNNLQGYCSYFEKRRDKLFDLLSIPDHVDVNVNTRFTPYSDNPRDEFGLEHFIYYIDHENEPLQKAIEDYPSHLEYVVEKYHEEEERRRRQRQARREAIGKFARDSAAVATGVTVGNTLTGNTGGKSDAAPGKANARCPATCPNHTYNGKCKVGSHPSRCENSR